SIIASCVHTPTCADANATKTTATTSAITGGSACLRFSSTVLTGLGTRGGGTSINVHRGFLGFRFGAALTGSSLSGVRDAGRIPSGAAEESPTAGTYRGVGIPISSARSAQPQRAHPLRSPPVAPK